ncbi:MAG TPA: twin-arginine translocase subunit TatC [bacterium]|nr:twin-arginine translocase subunit TatC [bacterium]
MSDALASSPVEGTVVESPPRAAPDPSEMPLMDHLGELRTRLIRSALWLLLAGSFALWQWEAIYHWLAQPFDVAADAMRAGGHDVGLMNRAPQGRLMLAFRIGTVGGLVLASPLLLAELWGFVAPGLTRTERRAIGPIVPVAMVLFVAGALFARYVLFPPMLHFMLSFGAGLDIEDKIDIATYLPLVLNVMVAMGVAFEIPVLTFALVKMGIVTGQRMASWRRGAIVLVAVLAAVITPTPDPVNMALVAVPLYLLYEISILVAVLARRR